MASVVIDPDLVDTLYEECGAAVIVVAGASDLFAASDALNAARRRIQAEVRHPEEPSEPFASHLSEVGGVAESSEAWFWGDFADAGTYRSHGIFERVLEIVREELVAAGVSASVRTGDPGNLRAMEGYEVSDMEPPRAAEPWGLLSSDEVLQAMPAAQDLGLTGLLWRRTVSLSRSAHRFCSNDAVDRGVDHSADRSLAYTLVGPGIGPWISCKAHLYVDAKQAARSFAALDDDLACCNRFESAYVVVGLHDVLCRGEWRRAEVPTGILDGLYAADLDGTITATGQAVTGRVVFGLVSNVIVSLFAHSLEPVLLPPIDDLMALTAKRLSSSAAGEAP